MSGSRTTAGCQSSKLSSQNQKSADRATESDLIPQPARMWESRGVEGGDHVIPIRKIRMEM
jgi:hemin uptake protein HemP